MSHGRVLLGLLLVVIGVVWTLDRLGSTEDLLQVIRHWWPAALIVAGLINLLASSRRPWTVVGPLSLLLLGGAILAITTGAIDHPDWALAGPLGLVALGTLILLLAPGPALGTEPRPVVWAVLRGRRLVSTATELRQVKARAVLGEIVIDLRSAERATVGDVDVHITGIFGRVEVIVTVGWPIKLERPVGVRPVLVEVPYDVSRVGSVGQSVRVSTLGILGGAVVRRM